MAGIVSIGKYIPYYRITRDMMAVGWGRASQGGERAVASYDQDTITLGVEAALDCLDGRDCSQIDAVFFASTTSPYLEKQASSLIATVLDLSENILTIDFASSLRAASNAIKVAMDAIEAGTLRQVLVVASDMRNADEELEQTLGDAAVAILLGKDNVMATIVESYFISNELTMYWRTDKDEYIRNWEERFTLTQGYEKDMNKALSGLMKKANVQASDIAQLAMYAPDARRQAQLAKRLGFDPKQQIADLLNRSIGLTGSPHSFLVLAAALENAKAGDRMIVASYGDGASAILLTITDNIVSLKRNFSAIMDHKAYIPQYLVYQRNRGFVKNVAQYPPIPGSMPMLWRQTKVIYSLHGSKCANCGTVHFPPQEICSNCHAEHKAQDIKLSRRGTVFTYAEDYLSPLPNKPNIVGVVDLDGGGRVFLNMVEIDPQLSGSRPEKVDIPVELTFRKMHDAGGFHNYYWKARPAGK